MITTTGAAVILSQQEFDAAIDATAKRAVAEMLAKLPSLDKPRPPHVNKTQAAEMLEMSVPTVTKLINSGSLRLNKCGLIPTVDIDRIIVGQ
jgi:endonuclease III